MQTVKPTHGYIQLIGILLAAASLWGNTFAQEESLLEDQAQRH